MGQSLKSQNFYAPAILVTLILFDEVDFIFTLFTELAEQVDYTPIELNEYKIDKLRSQSRAEKIHYLESNLNDLGNFNGNTFGLRKVVSDYVNIH